MIHLETEREHFILRDEMKVMIARKHTVHRHLTTRSDNEEILHRFLSKMDEIERDSDEAATEAKRRAGEVHANT